MNRIENKNVIITGASAGIGEACAKRFAASKANLVLIARRGDRLVRLREELAGTYGVSVRDHTLDVRDREAVKSFASGLKNEDIAPDVLVNNAGLASGLNTLFEGDYDDWDKMIDTNIKGLLNVTREILPLMVKRNRGHVVNVGSIAGHIVYPNGNVYNATKFAVRAINEAMNIDLVGTRIRVSSIDPGATATEFSEVRLHGDKERAKALYRGFKPLTGEDIADAVHYVVNAPEHVNVLDMIVMPTDQRSPYVMHRSEEGD